MENNEELDQPVIDTSTLKETDKKCPNCGAALIFTPETGRLRCPYCETEIDIPLEPDKEGREVEDDEDSEDTAATSAVAAAVRAKGKPQQEQLVMEVPLDFTPRPQDCDWGTAQKVVSCKSCGAQIIYRPEQIADVCPYCESNHVVAADLENTLAPNGICPFKVSREDAVRKFKTWMGKRWFVPSSVKEKAEPEKIFGVYLPYWTFDCDVTADYQAEIGRTVTRVGARSGKPDAQMNTSWSQAEGRFKEFFDDFSTVGSKFYDTKLPKGIEPFETQESVPYKPEYTAGFLAERYSIDALTAWENAQKAMTSELDVTIANDLRTKSGADKAQVKSKDVKFSHPKYKYLLLPVWLASYRDGKKLYYFAVNGQTGQVDGNLPVSFWQMFFFFVGLTLLLGIFLNVLAPLITVPWFLYLLANDKAPFQKDDNGGKRRLTATQMRTRHIEHTYREKGHRGSLSGFGSTVDSVQGTLNVVDAIANGGNVKDLTMTDVASVVNTAKTIKNVLDIIKP